MTIKVGTKLSSNVCDTQIMALRLPSDADIAVFCGGAPMSADAQPERSGTPAADAADGTLVGKRYVDGDDSMEFLCTRGGAGSLAVNGRALAVKTAKALPSSD